MKIYGNFTNLEILQRTDREMPYSQLSCKNATACQEADGKARFPESQALIAEKTPRYRKKRDHVIFQTVARRRRKAEAARNAGFFE